MAELRVHSARFTADLQALADQLDIDIAVVVRRVALQAFTGIVEKTPVDTGRARSNWAINVGAPAPPPSNAITAEESARRRKEGEKASGTAVAAEAMQEASAAVFAIDGTQSVHITNNLPYISRLNEGHSRQAPAGFVEATVAEIDQQIIDIVE